jgi:lipopolysaccharide export system protein LptC
VLVVTLLSVLALGSFWVLEVMRRSINDALPAIAKEEPDYYVEKFVYVKMSSLGHARYNIAGTRLTHFPKNDSYEIQQPILDSRSNPQSPMTLSAERAIVDHGASNIHMIKNVRLDRPASAKAERFQLNSDYLLILPDDDVMQTDKAVEMTLGRSSLTGIGMSINNATREFQVLKQAHVTYQAASQAVRR